MREEERDLLTPWLEAFARVFEEEVSLDPLTSVEGEKPADLGVLTFPDVARPPDLIGGTGHFRHMPEMTAYVQSLGYKWRENGRLCSSPTPATFMWLMEKLGRTDSGYEPVYYIRDDKTLTIGTWLTLYLDGKIPLHVRNREQYKYWLRDYDPIAHREGMSFQVCAFLHDLTVHLLNYHLIPKSWIASTTDKITAAMPKRVEQWREKDASGPLSLSFFFDNDLNQYAFQVWCRCQKPDNFADIFMADRNLKVLNDALTLRINQTKEGVGDVVSGDTEDATGLQPLQIRLP